MTLWFEGSLFSVVPYLQALDRPQKKGRGAEGGAVHLI